MNKFQLMLALTVVGVVSSLLPDSAIAQSISPTKDASKSVIGEIQTLDNRLAQSSIQVTEVKVNSNDKGIEVLLQTTASDKLQISSKTEENYFIADIPNAQLRFPSGSGSFIQMNPGKGIEMVTVANTANGIQVKVKGETAAPSVELFDGDEGLIFAATTFSTTTEVTSENKIPEVKPAPTEAIAEKPAPSKPKNESSDRADETIELSVSGSRIAPITGSKTDTLVRDIPASIQVVEQDTIKEQGGEASVDKVIRNVSGVQQSSTSNYGFFNNYSIRGLQQTFLRDGVPDGLTVNGYARTLTDIERVEVLKGPGSALYGTLAPGGTVNLVRKRAQETPAGSVKQTFGSFGASRTAVDLTGPLTNDKKLLYRFNGAFQYSDGYRGLKNETLEILPSLTWKPNDFNTVNIDFDYRHIEVVADSFGIPFIGTQKYKTGVSAVGTQLIDVPRDTRYYSPFATNVQDVYRGAIKHEWQASDNFLLRNSLTVLHRDVDILRNTAGGVNASNGLPAIRGLRAQKDKATDLTWQTEGVLDVATGGIQHKILGGFEYQVHNIDTYRDSINFPALKDLYNPVLETSLDQKINQGRSFDVKYRGNYYALYLQDQIKFSEQFKARIGGRWDQFGLNRTGYVNALNSTNKVTDTFDGELSNNPSTFSYQAGLVYQPIPALSVYGGVSKSHLAALSTEGVNIRSLDPAENALQYEAGIKTQLFDGKLTANFAYFDVTRKDFIVTIGTDRLPVGAQKTKGYEIDLNAEPIKGWKLLANYANYDATLTNLPNDRTLEGNRSTGVPKDSASLWTTYEIQSGALKGFGMGGGLTYRNSIYLDQQNTREIPGYTTLDLVAFYRRDNFEAQLNFNNVTDVAYFRNGSNTGALPGEPFNISASVGFKF